MQRIGTIRGNPLLLNLLSLGIAIILYLVVCRDLWGLVTPAWVKGYGLIFLIGLALALMFAHEGIHMLSAKLLSKDVGASLKIKILTWECRLKGPLGRNDYIIYALAPGIILGLLGAIGHSVFDSVDMKYLSAVIFLIGLSSAGGDCWFVARVLQFPSNALIYDHGLEMEIVSVEDN